MVGDGGLMTRREMLSLISITPFIQVRSFQPIVTTDIIGTPRPQGRSYDIGAYEFIKVKKSVMQPSQVKVIR